MLTNQAINDGMGGSAVSRDDAMKQYKNPEKQRKKYLKALKKKNTMIHNIAKKSGLFREIKKIKNIQEIF